MLNLYRQILPGQDMTKRTLFEHLTKLENNREMINQQRHQKKLVNFICIIVLFSDKTSSFFFIFVG